MSERHTTNTPNTTNAVIRVAAENPAPVVDQPTTEARVPGLTGPSATVGQPVAVMGTSVTAGPPMAVTGEDETEDLREEIEETRTELSATLNAIQEKLAPQRLMDQAKDAVQDTTEHVVDQAKHAAHEVVVDAVGHTKEAVHDATIGKVEHMVSNVTDATKNLIGSATGPANQSTATAYGTDARSVSGVHDTGVVVGPTPGVGASLWETIKENPIPTALAAASLGWLFAHRSKTATARRNADMSYPSYQQQSFRGQDTGRVTGDTLQDKAGQVANQVGSTVSDTADTLQDKAGQVANQVGSTVGNTVGQVGSTAGQVANQVGSTVGNTVGQVGSTVGGLAEGTQQQAQRAQGQFQRVLHENPLAVGAAGLALGAAIGLVIPETQRENRLLGEARDTAMDKAIGTAQDTMQKVGTIARKAESAAEGAVKDEAQAQGLTS